MRCISGTIIVAIALITGSCGSGDTTPQPVPLVELNDSRLLARVGEAITDTRVIDTDDLVDAVFSIDPAVPEGLRFNPLTATISGTPATTSAAQPYTVTLNAETVGTFDIAVGPALPQSVSELDHRFAARVLVPQADVPVRMARATDGRVFYIELSSGKVRVIDPQQGLLATPMATISITSGAEKGLLGLALDPAFDSNGYMYLHATVPADATRDERAQIMRLTIVDNISVATDVVVDQLPVAAIHNGGELVFDKSGHLFVGRGDTTQPISAQTTGDLSGKILRYTRDGAIPDDNPFPGDPEWARGIRNTFAMTLHPQTGDLFGADPGPASDDKLNYLLPAKNFTWGMETEAEGSDIGFTIRTWPEVITPTGLMFHSGRGASELENNLFISSYNDESILRLVLVGERYTDFIREVEFARFVPNGIDNKPLHLIEADDGSLYISTFSAIFHVFPIAP
jgi:glucose/arabinose dehydrogenase